jgi:hypothetical protein
MNPNLFFNYLYKKAGFWSLGFRNYVIGNRFSNYFNGLLFSDEFSTGRQLLNGLMCGNRQRFGRIEGNTLHQCGRFGTYVVVNIYPENVQVSIESDGIPINKKTDCRSWLPGKLKHFLRYFKVNLGKYRFLIGFLFNRRIKLK